MPHVVGEIVITRPVEQVFDFVADERNEPRFNPKMLTVEKVTPGPVGKGTRFRAQVKTRQRTAEMSVEFTAYDRPRRLTSVSKLSNMEIEGTRRSTPFPRERACVGHGISHPVEPSGWRRRSSAS